MAQFNDEISEMASSMKMKDTVITKLKEENKLLTKHFRLKKATEDQVPLSISQVRKHVHMFVCTRAQVICDYEINHDVFLIIIMIYDQIWKTDHVSTTNEMCFVAPYHRCTFIHYQNSNKITRDCQVCFSTWLFLGHAKR